MRYLTIALALFALPVLAAPKEIAFKCDDDYCVLSKADWQWMMHAMQAKDEMLKRCGVKDS